MKKILVIGAGFLQSYVIKKAKEMGYYTLAVDANLNAVGFKYADEFAVIDIVDSDACLKYAAQKEIDGVMTAATDYGVLTASYIAEKLGLAGISQEAARAVKNKYEVRRILFNAGADDTKQAFLVHGREDAEQICEKLSFPVMVKPCDGSGSRGASKAEDRQELLKAVDLAVGSSLSKKALVESFIVGKEYGVESIVLNGEVTVLAVMKKEMTQPPYYAELGHSIPSQLPSQTENYIKSCAEKAIRALNIKHGAVNMDLILTSEGKAHIVDIGARMGGNLIGSHIIKLGTGVDYLGALIASSVRDKADISTKTAPACVSTRLLALDSGKVQALPDFNKIEKEFNVKIYHHLSVGDIINPYRTNLDGCGYVVATAQTHFDANAQAQAALEKINHDIKRK